MSNGNFPTTDEGLRTFSANFASRISIAPADYGLTAAQATAYQATDEAWQQALSRAVEPLTRTKGAVAAKNTQKTLTSQALRSLIRIVEAFPDITDQLLVDLGLNPRKQPSPVPVPTARPGVHIVSADARNVLINIHDTESVNKRGKAPGTVAAWVYSFVGAEYPSDPSEWDFQGSATTGKFQIEFPSTLPGGTQVWICCAWINARQEAGPVSRPLTINLQGGGGSIATPMKVAA